jgi:hypothetical protein
MARFKSTPKIIFNDTEGNRLEKGFYGGFIPGKSHIDYLYFTGKYDRYGDPLFRYNKKGNLYSKVMEFTRLKKREIRNIINRLKKEASWLENELENQ